MTYALCIDAHHKSICDAQAIFQQCCPEASRWDTPGQELPDLQSTVVLMPIGHCMRIFSKL